MQQQPVSEISPPFVRLTVSLKPSHNEKTTQPVSSISPPSVRLTVNLKPSQNENQTESLTSAWGYFVRNYQYYRDYVVTANIGVTNNLPIITILHWYEINLSNAL